MINITSSLKRYDKHLVQNVVKTCVDIMIQELGKRDINDNMELDISLKEIEPMIPLKYTQVPNSTKLHFRYSRYITVEIDTIRFMREIKLSKLLD